jgi:hypothetical protein
MGPLATYTSIEDSGTAAQFSTVNALVINKKIVHKITRTIKLLLNKLAGSVFVIWLIVRLF